MRRRGRAVARRRSSVSRKGRKWRIRALHKGDSRAACALSVPSLTPDARASPAARHSAAPRTPSSGDANAAREGSQHREGPKHRRWRSGRSRSSRRSIARRGVACWRGPSTDRLIGGDTATRFLATRRRNPGAPSLFSCKPPSAVPQSTCSLA